ncbi:MAG: signal peptidase II [Actinomycetota bacterium]|nr:signal peptidase II [Actinomycetota bacterium]
MQNDKIKNKYFNYNIKQFKLDLLFAICAIFAIVVDQITKYLVVRFIPLDSQIQLIPNFLYLTHIKNSGAAFGIFQGKINVFIVISVIAIVLIIFLKATLNLNSFTYNLALGLILGGAIGNLFDRYFVREVTDFIYVVHFAVFNGADSFINIGFFILLVIIIKNYFIKDSKHGKKKK